MHNNIIQFDKSKLRAEGISLSSFLFMIILTYYSNIRININLTQAISRGFIMESDVGYLLTQEGLDFIEMINSNEVVEVKNKINIEELAEEMRLIYPEGKKVGTSKYWRDNKSNVTAKLKSFFKKYGEQDIEVVKEATRKYINSFGDNKQLMRVLPYFIEKDGCSDLMTTIENMDSMTEESAQANNDLWTSVLV